MATITNPTKNTSFGANDVVFTESYRRNITLTGSSVSINNANITIEAPIDNIEVVNGTKSSLKSLKFFYQDSSAGVIIRDFIDISGGEINMGPKIPATLTLDYSSMGVDTPIYFDFLTASQTPEDQDNGLPGLFYGTALGNIFDDLVYDQTGEESWEQDEGGLFLGMSGDDIVDGTPSVDYLFGGNNTDFLEGYGGADYLFGDGGNDLLAAGSEGADALLAGGAGNDIYAISLGGLSIFDIENALVTLQHGQVCSTHPLIILRIYSMNGKM